MNVFDIRNNVVDHHAEYMKSFVRISDTEIKGYVEDHLSRGRLWPDSMVQLNPSFAPGGSIGDGTLRHLSEDIAVQARRGESASSSPGVSAWSRMTGSRPSHRWLRRG